MTFGKLFFGFDGRIGRKTYILSIIGVFVASFVFAFLLTLATNWRADWISVITTILFFWPGVALGVKRAHDRQRSAAWYVVAVAYVTIVQIMIQSRVFGPVERPEFWPWWAWALTIVMILWMLWLFVELVFLRGTYGENRYGPDPINPV
jgi:uncharacterized membrane protein YhaH (DUF805 family)